MKSPAARRALVILALAALVPASAQFAYELDSPFARENFRTGVEAYHAGRYAESLQLFERTLTESPSDPLVLYWLGKSYYRLGYTATAMDQWNAALSGGGVSPFLESRVEMALASLDPLAGAAPVRYVRVGELAGVQGRDTRFLRPSWLEPLPDGSVWVVAHGSDQLVRVSANGQIIQRLNAGSTGFDRPFGMAVLPDGTMFVSEFQSNRLVRLSADGKVLGYSGGGSGVERLAGPQFLCADADGFVYVTDAGFSRVVKYAPDGVFVSAFGGRSPSQAGLGLPTGIAAGAGKIYVADAANGSIAVFDGSGNRLGTIAEGRLSRPEGMRWTDRGLLVADSVRVVLVDPETEAITELYRTEGKGPRLLSAAFDANGDLLAADFDGSELLYLADPTVRYAGLSVEVLRIGADRFPRVSVDVRVLDRFGKPLVGLSGGNFYLSEGVRVTERRVEGGKTVDYFFDSTRPAAGLSFDGSLSASGTADVCLLLEGSVAMAGQKSRVRDLVSELIPPFGTDASFRMVTAGRSAQPALAGGVRELGAAALALKGDPGWDFEAGLRLAAGSLFPLSGRRAIIHLGTGSLDEERLSGSSIAELGDLLAANGISFHVLVLGRDPVAPALEYLAGRTGGRVLRADRPEGLASVAADIRAAAAGIYRLSFQSGADGGFGLSYLPISVEVYMRDRSGKDETGYFSPLR